MIVRSQQNNLGGTHIGGEEGRSIVEGNELEMKYEAIVFLVRKIM